MKRSPLQRKTELKPESHKRKKERPHRRAVREAVFKRDKWRCAMYGRWGDCYGELTPHHIDKRGPYSEENLLTLCAHHNTKVEDDPKEAARLRLVLRTYLKFVPGQGYVKVAPGGLDGSSPLPPPSGGFSHRVITCLVCDWWGTAQAFSNGVFFCPQCEDWSEYATD